MTDLPKFLPATGSPETTKFVVSTAGFGFITAWLLILPQLILSPDHLARVSEILAPTPQAPIIIGAVLAWLLIHVFEVHESIYDRLFVKWRARHDRDYLLPKLLSPFQDHLVHDYLRTVQPDARKYIDRIFCPFITGDFRIPRETVSRFYRALSWYWVTQLFEIFLLSSLLTVYLYGIWGRATDGITIDQQAGLLVTSAGLVVLSLINNLWLVRKMRRTLRNHSEKEIDEIFFFSRQKLETLVLAAAGDARILRPTTETPAAGWTDSHKRQVLSPDKTRVYVAAPMRSLDDEEYDRVRALMLRMSDTLRNFPGIGSVHYPGAAHPRRAKRGETLRNLNTGLRELARCDVLVLYYPQVVASSVLFEAGYALARGKQVILLVHNADDLPSLLRAAGQLNGVWEFVCTDEPSMFSILSDVFGEQ